MKKPRLTGILSVAPALFTLMFGITGCAGSRRAIFEPGWTHFEELTMIRDIDFDSAGHLWAAGYKGIFDLDPREGSFQNYTSKNGLPRTEAWTVEVAEDDTVWVGLKRAGAAHFADGTWTSWTPGDEIQNSEISNIFISGDDTVILETLEGSGGLDLYDGSIWTRLTERNGLAEKYVVDVAEAPDGSLWFLTYSKGVCVRDGTGNWTYHGPENGLDGGFYEAIDIAEDGGVWVGTTSEGVFHFIDGSWKHYTSKAGLIDNSIITLTVHPDGSVWFGTPVGASRFDGSKWTDYTSADGLPSDYVEHIEIAPDDTVCFATGKSVSCLKM